MKKKQSQPSRSKLSVLRQLCNWIPNQLTSQLARETGVNKLARTFSPWSHVVSLLFAQLSHSLGLNDVCDALQLHAGPLSAVRGATPPSRNNLSHANKRRDAGLAEKLFWQTLAHLQSLKPGFARGTRFRLARRFKRVIHVVDSTTIELVASCLDWAKHRRRKAAAKCHLRLDLQSFLPRFAIVDTAGEHDAKRAQELCAGIRPGEIVIFDKAYLALSHLWDLGQRGVFWVTRAKESLDCRRVRSLPKGQDRRILQDQLVKMGGFYSKKDYPQPMRRILARIEVDGQEMTMTFLTNNLEWSASTIADLYRCRWQIEVFFKQIKQTLQLSDFLGQSANAVRWQIWMALLLYVLLRFTAWVNRWPHHFTRLFAVVRSVLWERWDLAGLLRGYGTAQGSFRCLGQPEQAYLPHLL
ncbi:MAG TPA: IS4 family transposase [Candidatus Cybelea sp.]|nr:IS4 family transposase [Candidatus Cybelea sp.]